MASSKHYYRSMIREPEGSGERLVVERASRAFAERSAIHEANKKNWDWIVEHCVDVIDEDDMQVRVIEQWSSIGGHESV